ncbi:hypothetical protein C5167_004816 [Papaver somniferum]|uniref:Uncharacterized protein n=1 Tax=Papaver somniferum TaxID=3469 RepID=A0A4Y7JCP8_PAPSO|nr:hypothetical protein C5167_004816 [Papaver somniferum]
MTIDAKEAPDSAKIPNVAGRSSGGIGVGDRGREIESLILKTRGKLPPGIHGITFVWRNHSVLHPQQLNIDAHVSQKEISQKGTRCSFEVIEDEDTFKCKFPFTERLWLLEVANGPDENELLSQAIQEMTDSLHKARKIRQKKKEGGHGLRLQGNLFLRIWLVEVSDGADGTKVLAQAIGEMSASRLPVKVAVYQKVWVMTAPRVYWNWVNVNGLQDLNRLRRRRPRADS